MSRIKSITIITAQGVNIHRADANTVINPGYYRIAGDPYECFHVVKCGEITKEIRCVHNLEIEFFPEK